MSYTLTEAAEDRELDICKQHLNDLIDVELGQLRPKAKIITQRYWQVLDAGDRTELKSWATDELSKVEGVPGSGVSKVVPTGELDEVSRRMAMLQEVLKVISSVDHQAA
jgi:hypothetical protein